MQVFNRTLELSQERYQLQETQCFVFLLKQNHSQFSSSLFGLLLYLNYLKIFFSFWDMAFLAVLCVPFPCSLPVLSSACLYVSFCCGRCSFIIYAFPLWMAFAQSPCSSGVLIIHTLFPIAPLPFPIPFPLTLTSISMRGSPDGLQDLMWLGDDQQTSLGFQESFQTLLCINRLSLGYVLAAKISSVNGFQQQRHILAPVVVAPGAVGILDAG